MHADITLPVRALHLRARKLKESRERLAERIGYEVTDVEFLEGIRVGVLDHDFLSGERVVAPPHITPSSLNGDGI